VEKALGYKQCMFTAWCHMADCWCRQIARFCHPSQPKGNTKSKKHLCKNSACSQHVSCGRLMQ
jgi:hypothetical protein